MARKNQFHWWLTAFLVSMGYFSAGQRVYKPGSVLAGGNWFKIAVNQPGIYKIDIAFLNKLGVNTSGLASAAIHLYSNGGGMLPEAAGAPKIDDLFENAIWIEDGGDDQLNGPDYILFFAMGPHEWAPDSLNRRFSHRKNLYSEDAYYYVQIGGGSGKRVNIQNTTSTPNTDITSFNDRYFYELDTVNFLSSGKQWAGEEFSTAPGKTAVRTYNLLFPEIIEQPATLISNCLARSFGTGSKFDISVNGQALSQVDIPPVASGPYDLFVREISTTATFTTSQAGVAVTFNYTPGSFNSQGWLDWFEIHCRRQLSMNGIDQLLFRDWNSVIPGNAGNFTLQSASASTQVWDVTNPLEPVRMQTTADGSNISFVNDCSRLHEYVAFNSNNFLTPLAAGRVLNQDLHNAAPTDMLVITHDALVPQAQRLSAFHQQQSGLRTVIVTTTQVYNEFSSGIPDPTAIRDFVKMYYDKAGADTTKRPKYLLLFGDASFDYKNRVAGNTNFVPAYESNSSYDPLSTYTSDDYFGFLDDADDINGNNTYLLDIGIGRLPAKDEREAKAIVDKIIHYYDPKSFGPWRNELNFIADDEDANLHLQDAEAVANTTSTANPGFNIDKIYLDAYMQRSGSGGSRYPDVNLEISNKIFNGTLMWNYTGHGGFRRLAEEVILDQDIINTFNNPDKLPLFLTATCDFAPYDNPLVNSIGENLLLREKTGAIALMTTTRLVFAFSNRVMNQNYLQIALQKKADGTYRSLGEAVKETKNYTYNFFGDVNNNRKFTLLGDPALTLAFPLWQVKTTAVNGKAVSSVPDTLKALSQYTISGEITDFDGNKLSDVNGTVYPVVFDKAQNKTTLGNDPTSIITTFKEQVNILFRGKAKVNNGEFSYTFVVAKDIDYKFGDGKLSYYATDLRSDGNGMFSNIIVGGTGNGVSDAQGPHIQAYLNDEKFVSGGITNERPLLLLKLTDSSGINIMGTGIGHDLVAMLDNDAQQTFVLNQFYEADLDNFRKGAVRFQMPLIGEGLHHLTIKAWDVVNNSNETTIDFQVIKQQNFTLNHVLNYPNPFTTRTTFWFEHNRPSEELRIYIQVFTITGKLVKTLRNTIISTGNRSSDVVWDGRDEYGARLGRGVYIYRLNVQTSDGKSAEKWEKLYIL